eukprot:scaffold7387_cov408-Prasinococcus_capsulatus_cf.AAC.5
MSVDGLPAPTMMRPDQRGTGTLREQGSRALLSDGIARSASAPKLGAETCCRRSPAEDAVHHLVQRCTRTQGPHRVSSWLTAALLPRVVVEPAAHVAQP